ncbi:hypothetical protein DPMN_134197 [Dreissena polymorpha]|uniref:Uncharacterized protein n=1 Tax=Dreissena polymorpha TaxID=45954 RepID=A0A9D4FWS9_DREPO|nr:hypothetical protein DPMN_134197 [Dreissena polymorpha]
MARQRPTRGAPGLEMGPCIVEIDSIVIRDVQYQFEVNRLKGNFGWAWSMWAGAPQVEIDRIVIKDVQYQFKVNRLKGNFGWAWYMWAGAPEVEIYRIVVRDVQYPLEINRCRNEEVNFQGSSAYSVGGDSFQDGRTDGRRR